MKKLLLILLLSLTAASCSRQSNRNVTSQNVLDNITYFKDPKTGLCFASINSVTYNFQWVTSITCVPCDSLKKIGIK